MHLIEFKKVASGGQILLNERTDRVKTTAIERVIHQDLDLFEFNYRSHYYLMNFLEKSQKQQLEHSFYKYY